METIGEITKKDIIQEFIAYNIPRSPLLFCERQCFRNILKGGKPWKNRKGASNRKSC